MWVVSPRVRGGEPTAGRLNVSLKERSVLQWQGLVFCSIVRPGRTVPWQTLLDVPVSSP